MSPGEDGKVPLAPTKTREPEMHSWTEQDRGSRPSRFQEVQLQSPLGRSLCFQRTCEDS